MTHTDPLLAALADAARRKQQADHDIRLLLAYARTLVRPRPYRLADLATAAGMSISGARVAYTDHDAIEARTRVGGGDGVHGSHTRAAITALLYTNHDGTRAAIT
jgi:hypothetical protein